MRNLHTLPDNLIAPIDDGAAKHLEGLKIPAIEIASTHGVQMLGTLFQGKSVVFIFPRAGNSISPNPNPALWDSIAGARGCTPQSCGFRDLHAEFKKLNFNVFGLSVQPIGGLHELSQLNQIPFPLLSDVAFKLTDHLKLPTFMFEGERLLKRMAILIEEGLITKVFYPVFPPDKNAEAVLNWIR